MKQTKKSEKIVIVGGCGHVGLPLGLVFADRGMRVTLLDVDKDKVAKVNSGEMPFLEDGAEQLLRDVVGKSTSATTSDDCLAEADVVVTVVGTPVDRHLNPNVNEIYASIDHVVSKMRDDSL